MAVPLFTLSYLPPHFRFLFAHFRAAVNLFDCVGKGRRRPSFCCRRDGRGGCPSLSACPS